MDFNIRNTCISIMECSEIERRTIPVEEEETNSKIFHGLKKGDKSICLYILFRGIF